MFTVIGWNEDLAAVDAYQNVLGAKDQHVKVVDDRIYVPPLNKLVFAAARGELFRARLKAPSLRRLAYVHINPTENVTVTGDWGGPPLVMFQGNSPLPLVVGEGLEAEIYDFGAGAGVMSVIVGLADAPLTPVHGEIWTIRATATPTVVIDSWANAEITFEQTLPVGRYQIVGALCSGTDINAFRFSPIGAMYRPGGVALRSTQLTGPPEFRKGGIGVWCEFDSLTPPSIDVIGETAGDQGVVIFMDLIKIA